MFKVVFRLQAAAGHEGVCDADGGGVSELRSDVELIILLQKAAVNDAEDVLLVIVPIFRRKLGGDLLKLFREVAAGHVKPLLQRRRYRVLIFLPVLPQLGPGFLSAAGVSHIEHIAQKGPAAAVVDDGDARGSPTHIPAHPLIPEIIFRAGGGVGPLGVNQELLGVRIFIETARRGEKGRPFLIAAGDLVGGVVGQLRVGLDLTRHRQGPPSQSPGTGQGRQSPRPSCAPAWKGRCPSASAARPRPAPGSPASR